MARTQKKIPVCQEVKDYLIKLSANIERPIPFEEYKEKIVLPWLEELLKRDIAVFGLNDTDVCRALNPDITPLPTIAIAGLIERVIEEYNSTHRVGLPLSVVKRPRRPYYIIAKTPKGDIKTVKLMLSTSIINNRYISTKSQLSPTSNPAPIWGLCNCFISYV